MKLIKIVVIYIIVILLTSSTSYAITFETLSVELPTGYINIGTDTYQSADDNTTINISVTEENTSESISEVYTEENLEYFENMFKNDTLESFKKGVKKGFENLYGELDDDTFQKLYDSLNVSIQVNSSEIVNICDNTYKAFKFNFLTTMSESTAYTEVYMIISRTGSYNICTSAQSKEFFSNQEYKKMINSIEVSNPLSDSTQFSTDKNWDEIREKAFGAGITVLIISGISAIYKASKKRNNATKVKTNINVKEKNDEEKIKENELKKCKICGKNIPFNKNGTCEECHKNILEDIKEKNKNEVASNKDNEDISKEEDTIELLKKYKKLLDDGVITEEEFNEKKRKLL